MPTKQNSTERQPAPTASLLLNEVAAHQHENEDSDMSTLKDNEEEHDDEELQKIAAAIGAALVPHLQALVATSVRTVLHNAIQDLKHELLTEFTHRENRIVHYLGSKLTAFEHAQLFALPTTTTPLSSSNTATNATKKRKYTTTIPRGSTSGGTKQKSTTTTTTTRKNHNENEDGVDEILDEANDKIHHNVDHEHADNGDPIEEETNTNSSKRSPAGHPYPVFVKDEHAHAESYRRWKLIYTDVADYIANHNGRYPRLDYHDPSNSNTKVKLNQWVKNQKRFYSKASLPAHHPHRYAFSKRRLQDLEALPYWRWPKKKQQQPQQQHQTERPNTNRAAPSSSSATHNNNENTDTTTNATSRNNEENDQSISAQRIDV